jgi:hypothetical protein
MIAALDLDGGGSARILVIEGDRVSLSTSRAAPPGATLQARHPDDSQSILIKVRSCRREADGEWYRIDGRFVNLSRSRRERLLG